MPTAGYFLSRKKVTKERFKKRGISISPFFLFRLFYFASGGLLLSVATKVTKSAIQGGRKFRSSFPLENPPSLSDQRGRAAALPLWKHPPGVWAIINSRLCREAAKVGGGLWPPVGVKGRTDSHASDVGHWLGMTGREQGVGTVDVRRGGVLPRPYTPNIEPHSSAFRSKSGSGKRSRDNATFR